MSAIKKPLQPKQLQTSNYKLKTAYLFFLLNSTISFFIRLSKFGQASSYLQHWLNTAQEQVATSLKKHPKHFTGSHLQSNEICIYFILKPNYHESTKHLLFLPGCLSRYIPSPLPAAMKITKSNSRVVLSVSAMGLFILALIWVSYFRQRSFDRKDSIQFAIDKNSNLAVALEQYAISTLHNADALLQMIKMEYAQTGTLDIPGLMGKNSSNHGIIEGVDIIDRNGKVKISNAAYSPGSVPDLSGTDYFLFHSHNNIDSLLISKPLISRSTGKPVLVISRRLNDAKGRFAGVAALQISPSTFTSFYSQARLLPNDIISLIAPDGITYARRRGTLESSGEDICKSPLFIHVAQNADSFYFAKDAIRQVPTWFSYRKFREYPIIATVGSSEQDIVGQFEVRQSRYILPRIIISVLVILFSFLISLFLLHRRKLADRLLKEE
jgi:hypothetical protein